MTNTPEHATTSEHGTTVVLGGNGKTGGRIVERLWTAGHPVRVGSRTGEPPFDWEDRSTWAPVLHGASAAYVSFQPDLAVPGAPEAVEEFSRLAVDLGVTRLVLLSGRGEQEALRAEKAFQESGARWTILRCSWFAQNFSESFLLEPLLGDEVALPVAPVGEPFVDVEDIADVAFAALTQPGHEGQLYEITGPRLLTFEDAVAEVARVVGRRIGFVRVPIEDYSAVLAEVGLAPEEIALTAYLFTEVMDGRNAWLGDGVVRALGRQPGDFAAYVARTAATGVWNG